MATDFNKPVVTDAYATLLPGLVTANKDLAMMLEPTLTGTSTNLPTGAVRWNATTVRWERYNGTSWVTLPAAGNNVYAISISGNAATATLATNATTAASCSGNAVTASNAYGNSFFTAGDGVGAENNIGALCTGQQPAFLFNNALAWGLYSNDGEALCTYTRATGKKLFFGDCSGNAATATTAGSCSGNAATATLATKASTLSQGGANGTAMTFNWSGQSGQPPWLWGGSDGANMYVYNPSNFSVAYAASAGNVIGVGQTWQSMLGVGGRASGVTIYNTTGRPILVSVWTAVNTFSSISMVVNGVAIGDSNYNGSAGNGKVTMSAIIPNSGSYIVTATTISGWAELR